MLRSTSPGSSSVFVVVEGRAVSLSWPEQMGETPELGFSQIEQEEWEQLPGFLGRLTTALERDALDGPSRTVVLVASAWKGHADVAARRLLVLEMLTHLARTGGGRLVLTHDHLRDLASCTELRTMVSDLAEDWEEAGVLVSTRFDASLEIPEEAPESTRRQAPSRVHHARPQPDVPVLEPARVAAG